jgi:hypothetical protein
VLQGLGQRVHKFAIGFGVALSPSQGSCDVMVCQDCTSLILVEPLDEAKSLLGPANRSEILSMALRRPSNAVGIVPRPVAYAASKTIGYSLHDLRPEVLQRRPHLISTGALAGIDDHVTAR